ncbi:hypothetical protein HYDPIDRAFT_112239 [Hydnomerulius pinastri MD-312]|uniref:Pentacotripeptide-repeat region of PRORP domain-containing protein n=1 Tax=Hydnomerulius pinastri MD-312 TaxID=994086 RepID=A0A0C9WEV5_9AGAM|nr:hypothetical protein HYDPIDRAFT_112239 [Hydnomerulius pinastri MD-312]
MFLQSISLFPRSQEAVNCALSVMEGMRRRGINIWWDTDRLLLRSSFLTSELAESIWEHGGGLDGGDKRRKERLEVWSRVWAQLGRAKESAECLTAIREHCLQHAIEPPYGGGFPHPPTLVSTEEGIAHKANTQHLKSLHKDRKSAFRYLHHLLRLERQTRRVAAPSPTDPTTPKKSSVDIYDWTAALHAAAQDRALPTRTLLGLFKAAKEDTSLFKPSVATYTVLMRGLGWRGEWEEARRVWEELVGLVGAEGAEGDTSGGHTLKLDRKALCAGVEVLVRSGRAAEAVYLVDEFVKMEMELAAAPESSSSPSHAQPGTHTQSYATPHLLHALLTSLLRIRRPDVIFYIFTHLRALYFLLPTDTTLHILLKAAVLASKLDGESVRGALAWYIPGSSARLFRASSPIPPGAARPDSAPDAPRDALASHVLALLSAPAPPPVVGIWAGARATDVARAVFRGMILENWPALADSARGVVRISDARGRGQEGVFGEIARGLTRGGGAGGSEPHDHGHEHKRGDGESSSPHGALPSIYPSERTFAAYIALLGLSSRAAEIPEALAWMCALGVRPGRKTLSVALVFWGEVALRGPLFEAFWGWRGGRVGERDRTGGERELAGGEREPAGGERDQTGGERDQRQAGKRAQTPMTEYTALEAWIREWVGDEGCPTEEDIQKGIWAVAKMRDREFGKRGGRAFVGGVGMKKRGDGWGERRYGRG